MTERPDRPVDADGADGDWEPPPVPFSFKLTLILMGIYVAYRLVQMVMCAPAFFRGEACPFL